MRVLVGSLIGAGALLLLSPASAFAASHDDPVDLGGAYVLDASGVLGGNAGEVRNALDRLYDDTGAKVFVVYVDTFDNPADEQAWVDESADRSGLGPADLLLAIATEDRGYAYSTGSDFPVSDSDIARVVDDDLIPALRKNDWAGGAIAFADGLVAAQAPSPVPAVLGGVAVAVVGTAVAVGVVRSRRRKKNVADAAAADAAAHDQKAGILLVQLDDALKTSEQELGFAQAQFGDAQTRDFVTALADAKALAKQAFELQQKLDDAFPETPEQHRALTQRLIQLAEQADAVLDAQAAAFDELRQLEKNAAAVLGQVAAAQTGLDARIDAAATTIAGLKKTYHDGDLSTVTGVPSQAHKLNTFAAKTVVEARTALASAKGDASGVAVAVRAAQQAVGQVEQLLASVDRVQSDLAAKAQHDAAAAAALETELRDARARVADAQDYITTHRGAVGTTARTRISEATRHLDQAVALAASDADKALAEAKDAEQMAAVAQDLALADVEQAEGALAAPQNQASYQQGSGFDGALLGGILGSLFGEGGGSTSGSNWLGGSSSGGSSSGGSSSGSSWWGGGSSGSSGSGSSWSSSGWGGGSSHHSSGGGGLFGGSSGGGHSSGGASRSSGRSGGHGRF